MGDPRTDTSKQFKVKVMGASDSFSFGNKDWEQAVVVNVGTPDVKLKDADNNEFTVLSGASFNATALSPKALGGMTVVTASGGACEIAYFQ